MERKRRRTVSVAPSHTAAGLPTVTRRALPMLAPEHTVHAAPHVYPSSSERRQTWGTG